jgi:hypothetical protein
MTVDTTAFGLGVFPPYEPLSLRQIEVTRVRRSPGMFVALNGQAAPSAPGVPVLTPGREGFAWNRVMRSKRPDLAGPPGLGGRPRNLTAERHPLQIRADFSYNCISGKDKKWARQPIFFCFFGFGGQRN